MAAVSRREGKELILVVGATGRTGAPIVRKLLQAGFKVRAFVRDQQKARKSLNTHENLQLFEGDVYNEGSVETSMKGVSKVICATGSVDFTSFSKLFAREQDTVSYQVEYVGVKNLVTAAKQQNVEHFVLVSSLGVTSPWFFVSILLNTMLNMVMKWKLEGERCLRESGLTYTVVRPGGLTDVPNENREIKLGQGDTLRGRISRDHVADLCIQSLTQNNAKDATFECAWTANRVTSYEWDNIFASISSDKTPLPRNRHTQTMRILVGVFVGLWGWFIWRFLL